MKLRADEAKIVWAFYYQEKSCQEVLQELQIWMEKRYFAQLTRTGSEYITFERKKPTRLKT